MQIFIRVHNQLSAQQQQLGSVIKQVNAMNDRREKKEKIIKSRIGNNNSNTDEGKRTRTTKKYNRIKFNMDDNQSENIPDKSFIGDKETIDDG